MNELTAAVWLGKMIIYKTFIIFLYDGHSRKVLSKYLLADAHLEEDLAELPFLDSYNSSECLTESKTHWDRGAAVKGSRATHS